MTLAPTLQYAHKPTPIRDVMQGKDEGIRAYPAAKAWEELRALLAVARAAERWVAVESLDDSVPAANAMVRAVERLQRVSRPSSPRPSRRTVSRPSPVKRRKGGRP